jgi:hypothetical protein
MAIMLGIAQRTYVASSGAQYTADQYGIIQNVNTPADVSSLQSAGCIQLPPQSIDILGRALTVNFNSTADQLIALPTYRFRPKRIVVTNASVSLSTAAGGVYTGTGKTGTVIVAAAQVYSALTTALLALELTLNVPNNVIAANTSLYLSLTTPQGVAATADVYVYGDVYT